ncbi:Ig-like domain-containing protein [Demequina sp. SYSU T00192]|uniref:Ig-like domain-containing protein n=1 Tax=Demequina litoralis TaxID=3051660 RepID=A0ABT8GAA6_9MICO|nr:Ig-like domain-containing protein [Demequina sp. SYSU T00192]MDN4476060.1 Ig-like domain-containing protein [Demequina sp. SYSU T00192]
MTDVGRATAARRRRTARIVAGAVLAVATVGAIVAPGFDEREAVAVDPTVWALQAGAGERYARVNTELAEVDTVKEVDAPSEILQHDGSLLVLSAGYTAVTELDAGHPVDLEAGAEGAVDTPAGTTAIAAEGDVVAYLAADGDVLAGRISDGTALEPREIVLDSGDGLRAVAVAVTADGDLAAYSPTLGGVVRADADGAVAGIDPVPDAPETGTYQVSFAGSAWVLLEAQTAELWREGVDGATVTDTDGDARLQRPSTGGDVRIADGRGLVVVPADGAAGRVFGSDAAAGVPAAPAELDGVVYAAWLPDGDGEGTLWSSAGPTIPLAYGGGTLGERREPVLRSNGARMVLNEVRSGWVWEVPSGTLVRSSQDWVPDEQTTATEEQQDVSAEVRDPRPPVAEDDALGVRAGRQVRLPVLLNDHDANGDLLTIDAASLTQPDDAFATVAIGDDGQSLVATVAPGAKGSASFMYAISDGSGPQGLSEPATVTLAAARGNSAPAWCGVEGCVAEWPAPQVEADGTVTVDVLDGWVDPEGDPVYVRSAVTTDAEVAVAASPEGSVVVRHGGTAREVEVEVTVADARGATATRTMRVGVVGEPRLTLEPLAVTALAGVRTSIAFADRVAGGAGAPEVTEATVDPADGASVEVSPDASGVLFEAGQPGTYTVDVTVVDGAVQARGTARVTVLAPQDEALATVPLTAFVRPHEDVTVDVLDAVTNPGGRVLLLSDASVDSSNGARVEASIVGHGALRLSGTTGDGQPGLLGVVSYTVSDGSGRAAMTVRGEITVVLLDSAVPAPPLVADDAVTVRAGGQVDVRVLDNDVATAGAVIALDAGSVEAPAGGGLAFAAGPLVRILAPDSAGTYRIPYASYVLGFPSQRDTGVIVVTVTDGSENAAPTPRDLAVRASSGEEVRLELDGTGLDPDGDEVRLDAVVSQPAQGSARVSADGAALVYASIAGFAGQDEFDFQVIDARGRTATATARVGVVAVEADPAPVTYTDFVQVQAGTGRKVVVQPLANDLDLTGGDLELVDVRPDAAEGTDERAALAALLPADLNTAEALAEGLVTFEVGADVGTYAYLYTVRNATGSLAQGRIVLKAVRERVTDTPIVADTVLTLETRDAFPTGVDVLAGTVAWASGDAATLGLSLWGEQDDLAVSGSEISGPLPDATRIVPFRVEGTDFAGDTAVGYGFLRVLGGQDLRLALREDAHVSVDEGGAVTVDVAPLLAAPDGTAIELDGAQVRAGGARDQASCAAVAGTTVRYEAGAGAPYTDTCLVAVRLAGQDAWTVLPVPVTIVPADPVPTLVSASLEISPGDTAGFDLGRMVRWPEGAAATDVQVVATYSGQLFDVRRDGARLSIVARDDAAPGRAESVTVSLPDHPEVQPRVLSLVVGPAPSELPKGGSVVERCSQADGDSCTLTVVGAAGEVNPLPGTPLEVVDVKAAGDCPDVRFQAAGGDRVRVTWTADAAGGVCDAVFRVRDAQGRVSAADRSGSISLDLQGFPRAPAEVSQVDYGDGSVTLAVAPGGAAGAYPALQRFDVVSGGVTVTTCTAGGVCAPITGLANGAKATYAVYAVNSVGRSRAAASATAWAYAPPAPPTVVSWQPSVTSGDGGRIDLVLDVTDGSTSEVRIATAGTEQTVPVGTGTQRIEGIAIGSNTPVDVVLTPLTVFDLPPVDGAAAAGTSVTITAHGIGRPTIDGASHSYTSGAGQATITADVTAGGAGSATWVGRMVGGRCDATTQASGGTASFTVPVDANATNTVTVCAESRADGQVFGQAETRDVVFAAFTDPGAPVLQRGYRVASTCDGAGSSCTTALEREPQWQPRAGLELWYRGSDGSTSTSFADVMVPGRAVSAVAYYCVDFGGGERTCSDQTTPVTPESGARYRPTVELASCTVGTAPAVSLGGAAADFAATVTMLDGSGAPTTDAALMRTARVTVAFQAALAGIAEWTSADVACDGAPPDPDPDTTVAP